MKTDAPALTQSEVSHIIEMALSDHTAFDTIKTEYGLSEKQVVALMRKTLKPGSYRSWRARVARFGARRAVYK